MYFKRTRSLADKWGGGPRAERGAALVEFMVVLPFLMLIVVGSMRFGIAMNNYVILTEAVRAGARHFALSRGDTTPYTKTRNRVFTAAPNLGGIAITLSVNGTTCASDGLCQTALVSGADARVLATYPCSLIVMGINFAPGGCTMTSQMTERVE